MIIITKLQTEKGIALKGVQDRIWYNDEKVQTTLGLVGDY